MLAIVPPRWKVPRHHACEPANSTVSSLIVYAFTASYALPAAF